MTNQQNTKRVTITTDDDGKNVVIRNSQTGEVIPMVESCSIHIDASTVVPRASLTVWNPSIDVTCDVQPTLGYDGKAWPATTDAKLWADEFCRLNTASDHGTMLGWFANAIMIGMDTQRWKQEEALTGVSRSPSDEDADNAAEQAYWQFDARRSGYAEFRGHSQSERDAFKAEARELARGYSPVRVG